MSQHYRAVAAVVASVVVGVCDPVMAQRRESPARPVAQVAVAGEAVVHGVVTDAAGRPLEDAMVSMLGTSATTLAVTDRDGRFELTGLPPGPYLLRAHLQGYAAYGRDFVEVSPAGTLEYSLKLRAKSDGGATEPEVIAAGFIAAPQAASSADELGAEAANADGALTPEATPGHDHSELAWRLRHARRSVLKEATRMAAVDVSQDDTPFRPGTMSFFGQAMASSARVASSFFSGVPFTGEINLLTTGAIDSPGDLLSTDFGPRGVAYLEVGTPVGTVGAWSAQGAMTRGDVSSWIVAGSYVDELANEHTVDVGVSYAAQRYNGGEPAAIAALRTDSRTVSSMYGFDSWRASCALTVDYGLRVSNYDYLPETSLLSPRLGVTVSLAERTRVKASFAQAMRAPGAEEFLPPSDMGLWLPPERTFSPLTPGADFRAERARHLAVALERDLGAAYVVGVRRFSERVDDQLVTLFGGRGASGLQSSLNHYFVANGGNVGADGWGVTLSRDVAGWVIGSVDYSYTRARWDASAETSMFAARVPSAIRTGTERFHDVTTAVQTHIPETDTRVFVLYKINTAYASADPDVGVPGLDARFDVQVKQRLSFLPFDGSDWEVLVAVRNLFREDLGDGVGVYDELLVVKPPKRIVGGLLVRF
ncbi:MAG: TonB-dependent receptor [Vicinamibacterales bacterium]|nr:hypothetical protein [Acidobacteriota bacterium]MDP6371923.1 TonB-dependent receptor [Vicinamibacterales bacterium]MDP6609516.1 TonB-dependent receptor [Vicinamibacterales bacterium]|tara:strand:+ start:6319 stop:8268 length:1950 start_codon:yes stop_codon:yes gene_type:complete